MSECKAVPEENPTCLRCGAPILQKKIGSPECQCAPWGWDPEAPSSDAVFHILGSVIGSNQREAHAPTEDGPISDLLYGECPVSTCSSHCKEPLFPSLARDRAKARARIGADRAAAEERGAPIHREGCYFDVDERNELIDSYQDMIGRIISKALARGIPARVERVDVRQRLNRALIDILDRYKPVRGVTLDAYVWKCLNWELAKAINAENAPHEDTVQLDRPLADTPACGRRRRPGNAQEEVVDPSVLKSLPKSRRWYLGTPETDEGASLCGQGGILYKYSRAQVQQDIRDAVVSLERFERRVFLLWLDGYTQGEIGVHLGAAQSTVSRALCSAREKLRSGLAIYGPIRRNLDSSEEIQGRPA